MKSPLPEPDPHFGTDEEMLAWCEREGITPQKDTDGQWDWQAVLAEWESRNSPDASIDERV